MLKITSLLTLKQHNAQCDGYFFFDPIHPTQGTHNILAKYTAQLIDDSGIIFA